MFIILLVHIKSDRNKKKLPSLFSFRKHPLVQIFSFYWLSHSSPAAFELALISCELFTAVYSPQMMSRAAFVMKGKTSTGFPVLANGSNLSARTAPCSANTSQKPSRMLKWNVGVMSLRCWNQRSPVVVIRIVVANEMNINGTRAVIKIEPYLTWHSIQQAGRNSPNSCLTYLWTSVILRRASRTGSHSRGTFPCVCSRQLSFPHIPAC